MPTCMSAGWIRGQRETKSMMTHRLSRIDDVNVSECCATSRKKLTSRGIGFKVNSTLIYLSWGEAEAQVRPGAVRL